MVEQATIASVPLYRNLDRVTRGLAAMGIGPMDPIPPEALFGLDQWHYHGIDAIRDAARQLGLTQASHVLDVGSGIGGPARYLAHCFGCRVTALELQPELHAMGVELTRRCGLDGLVTHVCGDALTEPLPNGAFDAAVSWLAVLHVPDRPRLFTRLARALRNGGQCFVEDLCMRKPFAANDLRDLHGIVFGRTVTMIDDYIADLQTAGFTDIEATDMTSDWAPFAKSRLAAWRDGHVQYAQVHGEAAYAGQEMFYAVIARLYESGSLGGVRLTASAFAKVTGVTASA